MKFVHKVSFIINFIFRNVILGILLYM